MTDVVLVGLGGAGGIAAHVLTAAGAEVVALEAGPRRSAAEMTFDEIRNDVREWLAEPKARGELPTFRHSADQPSGPSPYPMLMANGVGGSTLHYPGLSARLDSWDFRHWPIDYAELEPYYALTERTIGVTRDLRRTGWTELMSDAATRLGWHPHAAPAAIDAARCTYCGFCTCNGCHVTAKGSTDATVIPRAEATGRLHVRTGARVVRIEARRGRVTGVTYVQDGRVLFQPAGAVLLGGFVYENVRLLLLSGLGGDQVGAGYMAHGTPNVCGRFPGRRLNLFSGLWSQATCVRDFEAGMLTASHEFKPIAASNLHPPSVPRWGAAWKAWLQANAQSVGTVSGQLETLPYEHNRLDLDPHQRDPYGVPVVRVTHRLGEHERRGFAFLRARMTEWLREAGADLTWAPDEPSVDARHCYGGTRMGDDPATSVVDRWGFVHGLENLGVLGASLFCSTGGVNPTLTVQALAWRTATRLTTSDMFSDRKPTVFEESA
ncbi:GMC family oxidoreductase [Solirubrobacter ginsenosidimutans]|uniref:GMC family oxidoreductase n=1 Tax=Solirubrobacter ginsenosidimutans TaxID=490573 RepID=A0A9X3N1K3_9ACTN|nr:GMC family oxidoreductase [Solirubrobacter ginsenosidimutans]MDA0165305.1 GMC family oxidoreductase [Solirubrobacter ginsenosidimutans]